MLIIFFSGYHLTGGGGAPKYFSISSFLFLSIIFLKSLVSLQPHMKNYLIVPLPLIRPCMSIRLSRGYFSIYINNTPLWLAWEGGQAPLSHNSLHKEGRVAVFVCKISSKFFFHYIFFRGSTTFTSVS